MRSMAIGQRRAGIGGTVQVPVHLDCVVLKPTLELDGEAIVREGELLIQ